METYKLALYYLFSNGKLIDGPYFTYPEAVKAKAKYDKHNSAEYKILETELDLRSAD